MKDLPPPLLRPVTAIWLFITLAFSACTPVTPSPVSTPDLPTDVGTAAPTGTALPTLGVDPASLRGTSLQVWHAFAGDSYGIFNEQVALFNAVNEWGITISASGYGDYLTLFEAMQAAIGAGGEPQMVVTLPEQVLAWETDGLVPDLDAYIHDPEYGLGSDEIADFPAAFWVQPGVPAQRSARFLFYNQTWAHELGFTAPPQTPGEFRQQACAANAAFKADPDPQDDGFGGWVVDANWQTAYSWLLAFGGGPADGEAYTFRTDDNQAALEFLKSLYDDNCAWLSTDAAPYEAFAARKALFVTGDLAEILAAELAMTSAASADEWTLIPFPGVEQPVAVTYGPSYTVLRSTPVEQLAAWLFARWMLSPENQALWVEATGLLPLRVSVLDMIGPYRSASPQWEAAAGSYALMETVPHLASWRKVRYVLADGLDHIFQVNLPLDGIPSLLDQMQELAEDLSDE
jgi:ABC-type glycerol-3-phosphate transport system substrate-binding protein